MSEFRLCAKRNKWVESNDGNKSKQIESNDWNKSNESNQKITNQTNKKVKPQMIMLWKLCKYGPNWCLVRTWWRTQSWRRQRREGAARPPVAPGANVIKIRCFILLTFLPYFSIFLCFCYNFYGQYLLYVRTDKIFWSYVSFCMDFSL